MSNIFLPPLKKQLLSEQTCVFSVMSSIPPLILSGPLVPPPLDLDTTPTFLPVTKEFIPWFIKWCIKKNFFVPIKIDDNSIIISYLANPRIILVLNPSSMLKYVQLVVPIKLFELASYINYDMIKSPIRFSQEQLRDIIYSEYHDMSLRQYILNDTGDTYLYSTYVYQADSIWNLLLYDLTYDNTYYSINFELSRMNSCHNYPHLFRWFNKGLNIILVITEAEYHGLQTQLILKLVRTDKLIHNLNFICTNSVRQSSYFLSNFYKMTMDNILYQWRKVENNIDYHNIIFRQWSYTNINVDINNLLCILTLGLERQTKYSNIYVDVCEQICEELVMPLV